MSTIVITFKQSFIPAARLSITPEGALMINSCIYFVGKKLLRSKSPLQSWCVVESLKLDKPRPQLLAQTAFGVKDR